MSKNNNNKLGYRYAVLGCEGLICFPIAALLLFLLPFGNKDISWGAWSLIAVALVFIMFGVYKCIKDAYIEAYKAGVAQGLGRSIENKLSPEHSSKVDTGLNDYFVKLKKKSYYVEFNSITFAKLHLDLDDIKTLKTEQLDNGITYYKIMLYGSWYGMQESYVIPDTELPLNTKDLPFNNIGIGKDNCSIYVEKDTYLKIKKLKKESNKSMSNFVEYKDIIAFSPGAYIQDIMEDDDLTESEFAKMLSVSNETVSKLVSGKQDIDDSLADKLEKATGISKQSWLNIQRSYSAKLRKINRYKNE